MNELEKAKHAKVQRIDVSDVNCRKCFYLNDKNFCIRNKFPVLNHPLNDKEFEITYVLHGWGLKDSWCVFAIKESEAEE